MKKGLLNNRYYGSHVISVPMILLGQRALISIRKLAHLPIKNLLNYEVCRKSEQSAVHAKPQQQSESLKVKDLVYDDDSLSFECGN